MAERKATMADLFKNGENFEFNKVDYSSNDMKKQIERIKKEQERIRKSAELPPLNDPFWHTPFNI